MEVFNLHGDKGNRTEEGPAALEGCVDRCEASNAHCAGWRLPGHCFCCARARRMRWLERRDGRSHGQEQHWGDEPNYRVVFIPDCISSDNTLAHKSALVPC